MVHYAVAIHVHSMVHSIVFCMVHSIVTLHSAFHGAVHVRGYPKGVEHLEGHVHEGDVSQSVVAST